MKHEDTLARLAASAATGDEAAEASLRREASLVVAQTGQRISGCDESCGWIWESARALETALLHEVDESDWPRLRVLELGSGTGWLALRLAQLDRLARALRHRRSRPRGGSSRKRLYRFRVWPERLARARTHCAAHHHFSL